MGEREAKSNEQLERLLGQRAWQRCVIDLKNAGYKDNNADNNPSGGLSEADVRRIAKEIVNETAVAIAKQVAQKVIEEYEKNKQKNNNTDGEQSKTDISDDNNNQAETETPDNPQDNQSKTETPDNTNDNKSGS